MFRIVTVADREYFQLVKVMLKSASVNFPEADFYIELVNMDMNDVCEIEAIVPEAVIDIVKISFANETQKKCYCGNRIASLLKELRNRFDDILIWADADMIFRKSCDEFIKIVSSCDFAANRRPKGKMIRTALLSFGNTKIATQLINKYAEEVEKINDWRNVNCEKLSSVWEIWMADTTVLSDIYDNEFKDKLNFVNLPTIYCDYHLSKEGVIWNGLDKNRKKDMWAKETEKWKK